MLVYFRYSLRGWVLCSVKHCVLCFCLCLSTVPAPPTPPHPVLPPPPTASTAAPVAVYFCLMQYKKRLLLGRSGPNLKPGTVRVCGMRGLRKGMHTTTQHPPFPASRAWTDPPTNVQAVSRAVRYVNTHRPRFQVSARPSYCYQYIYVLTLGLRSTPPRKVDRPTAFICDPVQESTTSKAFALTCYRALTWYCSPARPFDGAGCPATRYRAAREPLPRVPTAFQGSTCVRGELKRRKYRVKARYQVRANALLLLLRIHISPHLRPKGYPAAQSVSSDGLYM